MHPHIHSVNEGTPDAWIEVSIFPGYATPGPNILVKEIVSLIDQGIEVSWCDGHGGFGHIDPKFAALAHRNMSDPAWDGYFWLGECLVQE